MTYKPTDEAIKNPRVEWIDGERVGIGGEVIIANTPPKLPATIVIRECTRKEYKHFYMLGYTHLIKEHGSSISSEPDTDIDK